MRTHLRPGQLRRTTDARKLAVDGFQGAFTVHVLVQSSPRQLVRLAVVWALYGSLQAHWKMLLRHDIVSVVVTAELTSERTLATSIRLVFLHRAAPHKISAAVRATNDNEVTGSASRVGVLLQAAQVTLPLATPSPMLATNFETRDVSLEVPIRTSVS